MLPANLRAWLRPPVFADPDQQDRARNVFLLCAICVPALVIVILRNGLLGSPLITGELACELAFVLAVYHLNHRGWSHLAAMLLIGSLVVLTTAILFSGGDGSHDLAILVYPTTLVLAGLLLEWHALFIVLLLTLAGAAAVVSAEIYGWTNNRFRELTTWGDLVDMTVILISSAAIVGLWASQFRKSLSRSRTAEQEISRRNAELAEQADRLTAASKEWQATFDAVNVAVFLLDCNFKILRANRYTQQLCGESPAAVVGRFCWEVALGVTRPPADYPTLHLAESRARALVEKSVHGRSCEIIVNPVVDEQGHLLGAVHVINDITERKRAEMELRTSEARHRAILESSLDGLIVIDDQGRIVEFNSAAEAIFGHARHQAIGRSLADLVVPPGLRDNYERGLERYRTSRQSTVIGKRIEMPALRADGTEFRVELAIVPVVGTEPQLFAGVVRDITERLRLEQQLRQAQKMQAVGQLAGGVAHDFNNQLASVMGYAEILAQRLHDDPSRRYADNILQASRRAADLTQKLLAFSRKGKFIAMAVDLHEIIAEVIALLRHSLDKRIELRQHLEAASALTRGDPNQLQNALLNLAINARDAMPHGGLLEFSTSLVTLKERALDFTVPPGKYLRIDVHDTGIGMDDETRKHLFEPFFTTKKEGKGTGLGLAAVYGTVKNHHGAITVETEFGRGTTFQVYLPYLDPAERAEPPMSQTLTPARRAEARVLVVDDEEAVRGVVAEMLRHHGYRTVEFASGAEALTYYGHNHGEVDLVILDMVMPNLGGRETFAGMRKVNPRVRALLASGYSIDGQAQSILDDGVLGFVQKPFTQADLLQAVEQALLGQNQSTSRAAGA